MKGERRKGKERGPNVPGQVFAPAKNHATIAITTTLECFCRRGTIAPVYACTVLLLGLRGKRIRWEDEGGGHVSVRGIRGRGVHYRGKSGEPFREKENPKPKSISAWLTPYLSLIYFYYRHIPGSDNPPDRLLLSSLGLMPSFKPYPGPTLPPPSSPPSPCRSPILPLRP